MDNIFDFGGESESTPSAEVEVSEATAPDAEAIVDSNAGAEQDESTESIFRAQDEPVQDDEAPSTEAETPEDEVAGMEAEVEKALADERTPKWFKNAVENVYKPKLAELSEQVGAYEPLQQFGTTEEILQNLELLNGLQTIRSNPTTGIPELTTEPFVSKLYEQDPKVTYQLLNDLANLPSPYTQGYSVLQEMFKESGIDPSRLEDIRQFAANGYQLQAGQYAAPDADDLEFIPKELHATFSSLSPERRADLMASPEDVRNEALDDARLAQESKRLRETESQTREQADAQAKAQAEFEFRQTIDTKGVEHFTKSGEAVFTSFVDSLAKQANMSKMDSLMIANTVLNSFEPTLAGRQSLEALKEAGIAPDPTIQPILSQMEENARHIAYYEAIQDKQNTERTVAKQVELQERLTAKGNKMIAALALKRSQATAQTIQTKNDLLANTQTNRYAVAGQGASISSNNGQPDYDFSDDSYLEDLRASGFGNRR